MIRFATYSPDLRRVAFEALGKVWVGDVTAEEGAIAPHRLSKSSDREYFPAFSPDGKWIAYVTWNDTSYGQVMVAPASGGAPRSVTPVAGRYAGVAWSRVGQKLAFVRGGGAEMRGELPEAEHYFDIMWVG